MGVGNAIFFFFLLDEREWRERPAPGRDYWASKAAVGLQKVIETHAKMRTAPPAARTIRKEESEGPNPSR